MNLKKSFKTFVARCFDIAVHDTYANSVLSRLYVAQGAIAARQLWSLEKVQTLADVEFSIFSQWGEDGIIEWLVHHNGDMPDSFVEFGVEDYRESNTRFLLCNRNWRGLVIDGSPENMAVARKDQISWRHDLTTTAAFITKDNINELIGSAGFKGEIGILSVDIDGNDYWVWQAIDVVQPHFVIAEYNSAFGDLYPLSVPYDPAFVRSRAHHSNLYYGASIAALCQLAESKGYKLLGTNRAGSNVFFVRADRADRFADRISDTRPRPSRFREARDERGALTFARGKGRSGVIADLPVVDVSNDKTAALSSFGNLYSENWSITLGG